MDLCHKCGSPIKRRVVIDGQRKLLSGRKYCLDCSPFGRHNTKKLDGSKRSISWHGHSPETINRANLLYQSGLSRELVAKEMGISESTINNWMISGKIIKRTHAEAMKLARAKGRLKGSIGWTKEQKEKARQSALIRIEKDPSSHPNRRCAGIIMSYPERLVFNVLTEAKIRFEHNPRVCGYYPDFLIDRAIIEVDGERWHIPEKDAKRDSVLTLAGYKVHRFPAKQILKDPKIVLTVFSP